MRGRAPLQEGLGTTVDLQHAQGHGYVGQALLLAWKSAIHHTVAQRACDSQWIQLGCVAWQVIDYYAVVTTSVHAHKAQRDVEAQISAALHSDPAVATAR